MVCKFISNPVILFKVFFALPAFNLISVCDSHRDCQLYVSNPFLVLQIHYSFFSILGVANPLFIFVSILGVANPSFIFVSTSTITAVQDISHHQYTSNTIKTLRFPCFLVQFDTTMYNFTLCANQKSESLKLRTPSLRISDCEIQLSAWRINA